MEMKLFFMVFCIFLPAVITAQMVYADYEPAGIKFHYFGSYVGTLDSVSLNPFKSRLNTSNHAAKYTRRDLLLYDVVNINLFGNLKELTDYARFGNVVPKFKMKVYTQELPGTIIDLQLGKQSDLSYPNGVHSIYRGFTTVANEWEIIEFDFINFPTGSQTNANEVNRISIFFEPETYKTSTFYFDEISGPFIEILDAVDKKDFTTTLNHCFPNPASKIISIPFSISEPQNVLILIFDSKGNQLAEISNAFFEAGKHIIKYSVEEFASGQYYFLLKTNNQIITKNLLVSTGIN
jgi:hypothetical protein